MHFNDIRKFTSKTTCITVFALSCLGHSVSAQEMFEVRSSAFDHNSDIPERYSAYGENLSPDLSWVNLPTGTQQLALIRKVL